MKLTVLSALLLLIGCGGGKNPDVDNSNPNERIGSFKVDVLDRGTLNFKNSIVEGSGVLRFSEKINQDVQSQAKVSLAFELADGGSLTLVTYSDANLKNGVSVTFTRPKGTNQLRVVARADIQEIDLTNEGHFHEVDASEHMHLSVEIHNDHADESELTFRNVEEDNELLFDTHSLAAKPGKGIGNSWGLVLASAHVEGVSLQEPDGDDHDDDHDHDHD